jgi:hypothetical protein
VLRSQLSTCQAEIQRLERELLVQVKLTDAANEEVAEYRARVGTAQVDQTATNEWQARACAASDRSDVLAAALRDAQQRCDAW